MKLSMNYQAKWSMLSVVTILLLYINIIPFSHNAIAAQVSGGSNKNLDPLVVLQNGTRTLNNNLDEIRQALHNGNNAQVLKLIEDAKQNVSIHAVCMTSSIYDLENRTSSNK
jgi:hypothetical protein